MRVGKTPILSEQRGNDLSMLDIGKEQGGEEALSSFKNDSEKIHMNLWKNTAEQKSKS